MAEFGYRKTTRDIEEDCPPCPPCPTPVDQGRPLTVAEAVIGLFFIILCVMGLLNVFK